MAIQFARMEYVSRSGGGNVCRTSAYNKRDQMKDVRSGERYFFGNRGGNVHHEIILPEGASNKFLDSSLLWNTVELFENRKNSRLAKELVLALPDDIEITHEDRIELCRRFVEEHFITKGLAAQIDIHEPHHENDKNWHAHILVTTRRFSPDGEGFDRKKARDLDGVIRKGLVLELDPWGEIWRDLQNAYFKEKGLTLRVDPVGIIAQEHLGPVRMRHHMSEVVARGELLKTANRQASLHVGEILLTLTKTMSVFGDRHIEDYLAKHVAENKKEWMRQRILVHPELIRLYDQESGKGNGLYTTQTVRAEEEQVLRLAKALHVHKGIGAPKLLSTSHSLSEEQKNALHYGMGGGGIRIIQGRAGTGKSTLMHALHTAYTAQSAMVIGLAPTHTVVQDMQRAGFAQAQTIHSFLFRYKNDRIVVPAHSVFMVDEAGMVGTTAFGEMLKIAHRHRSKVILIGDDRQLTSVERGGLFKTLSEHFGAAELTQVYRQKVDWQKQVSEDLSQGKVREAVQRLEAKGSLHWHPETPHALSALVEAYSHSLLDDNSKSRLILAHSNADVDVINQAIQQVRQALGQVGTTQYVCMTPRGEVPFAAGDRVQCMRTDKTLGVLNGDVGTLMVASRGEFTIQTDRGPTLSFDPSVYQGLRLGYASTIYKSQGKTVDEAYVLHSPRMTENLSYVALTRQVKVVHLYVSQNETKTQEDLIEQMGRSENRVVSLNFATDQQMSREQKIQNSSFHKITYAIEDQVKALVQKVTDTLPNHSFYRIPSAPENHHTLVKEQNARERWAQAQNLEDKIGKTPTSKNPQRNDPEISM